MLFGHNSWAKFHFWTKFSHNTEVKYKTKLAAFNSSFHDPSCPRRNKRLSFLIFFSPKNWLKFDPSLSVLILSSSCFSLESFFKIKCKICCSKCGQKQSRASDLKAASLSFVFYFSIICQDLTSLWKTFQDILWYVKKISQMKHWYLIRRLVCCIAACFFLNNTGLRTLF